MTGRRIPIKDGLLSIDKTHIGELDYSYFGCVPGLCLADLYPNKAEQWSRRAVRMTYPTLIEILGIEKRNKMTHDVVKDFAGWGNHRRWTCFTCGVTIIRRPHMAKEQWQQIKDEFELNHPQEDENEKETV